MASEEAKNEQSVCQIENEINVLLGHQDEKQKDLNEGVAKYDWVVEIEQKNAGTTVEANNIEGPVSKNYIPTQPAAKNKSKKMAQKPN